MTRCTSAPITARTRVGISPPCGRKPAEFKTAGITKEVSFESVEGEINDRIDDAYRTKYKGSPYLDPMISARARSATVKVVERSRTNNTGNGRELLEKNVMKSTAAILIALCLVAAAWAQNRQPQPRSSEKMQALNEITNVSPALAKYAQGPIADLWKRPALSPRDRSIVTVAALIARNQRIEMPHYFNLALDNGVKPRELSEIITHLAFYSGWANAMSALTVAKAVFEARHIDADELPAASPALLKLDKVAEERRASTVQEQFGKIAPGLVQYTTDVLFRDLWLRSDLAPRDRSLVTVAALIATAQVAQITFHLNKAMDNGLTAEQAGEVVTHLAFYSGWPNAFSAVSVVKDVIEKRSKQPSGEKK
jgi:4-carboxymuconolactone decarboxylase